MCAIIFLETEYIEVSFTFIIAIRKKSLVKVAPNHDESQTRI